MHAGNQARDLRLHIDAVERSDGARRIKQYVVVALLRAHSAHADRGAAGGRRRRCARRCRGIGRRPQGVFGCAPAPGTETNHHRGDSESDDDDILPVHAHTECPGSHSQPSNATRNTARPKDKCSSSAAELRSSVRVNSR